MGLPYRAPWKRHGTRDTLPLEGISDETGLLPSWIERQTPVKHYLPTISLAGGKNVTDLTCN